MTDITALITASAGAGWLYLPLAVALGALHALEPGHSKSLMAAFIVAIRGTVAQAILLGICAAISHSLVVWVVAIIGMSLGDDLIAAHAEPWLLMISGVLIVLLAARVFLLLGHHHHDGNDHDHGHSHAYTLPAGKKVTTFDIAWFGFTGGLLPCPSAIAVLLLCLQVKNFTLGIAMVAAFSLGLAITLVTVGAAAAWGLRHASTRWSRLDKYANKIPYLSGALLFCIGAMMFIKGALAV